MGGVGQCGRQLSRSASAAEGAGGRGAQLGRHNYGSGTVLPAEFIANPELHTPEMLPAGAFRLKGRET